MRILITLAWRNLWRNRKRTLITISSVLFALVLAILFMAMEKGTNERMIENLVKYNTGYIQIQDVLFEEEPSIDNTLLFDDQLKAILEKHGEYIDYYVPRMQGFALAATESQTRGTLLTGVEPEMERRMNDISDNMTAGDFLSPGDQDVVIGKGLADILGVQVGDTLVLLGQGFHGATASGKYKIKGIADLKIPELNNLSIFMSIEAAQWFFAADSRLSSLIIMPVNPAKTNSLAQMLSNDLDSEWHRVLTWEEMLEDVLRFMKFDEAGTMVMILILYIIITFGLFGTILMMMIERKKEFGLLFSLGMKRSRLAVVCLMESLFISLSGVVAGVMFSLPVVAYFHYNPIRLSGTAADAVADYGFEPLLPFSLNPEIFYNQALIILIISLLTGLYPVFKVFRLKIMDVKD